MNADALTRFKFESLRSHDTMFHAVHELGPLDLLAVVHQSAFRGTQGRLLFERLEERWEREGSCGGGHGWFALDAAPRPRGMAASIRRCRIKLADSVNRGKALFTQSLLPDEPEKLRAIMQGEYGGQVRGLVKNLKEYQSQ